APVNGGKYVLKLHKQRYLCRTCGTTCGATSSNLLFNHTLTPAVHQAVIELAKDSLTATEIAKLLGISDTSVSRIINEHAKRPYRLKELPTQLCFDEFRSANHHMSFICCAALAHHLVTTLPGRLTTQIMDYFINRYSLTERQRVQSVVVDLNAQYC
ncbi:transposase, partial [Lactobacillus sp. LC28-10]